MKQTATWFLLGFCTLFGFYLQLLEKPVPQIALPDFSGIRSRELPISSNTRERVGDIQVLRKLYEVDQRPILVTVMSSSGAGKNLHDPTRCLLGEGWTVLKQSTISLPGGDAKSLRVNRGDQVWELITWFQSGKQKEKSMAWFKLQSILHKLTAGKAGEPLIMVSVLLPLDKDPFRNKIIFGFLPNLRPVIISEISHPDS